MVKTYSKVSACFSFSTAVLLIKTPFFRPMCGCAINAALVEDNTGVFVKAATVAVVKKMLRAAVENFILNHT